MQKSVQAASPRSEAQRLARLIQKRLADAQARLDWLVNQVARARETSSTYWAAAQRQARAVYEDMRATTKAFLTAQVPQFYDQGVRRQLADLKASEFAPRTVHYSDFVNSHPYAQGLAAILNESLGVFAGAYAAGEASFLRLMRYTQQVNLTEKQVNAALGEGYEDTQTPGGTARRLRDELLAAMEEGKYLSIVDKNGDTRRYQVDAYAEMVARTKLIEASTAGAVQATLAAGGDLVEISVHNTLCPVCQEFEGKVYSLSGTDPDFPPAEDLPPFHPNCEHTAHATFRAGMSAEGTLEDFIDFSDGTTDQHPTRESWVPVSQRAPDDGQE